MDVAISPADLFTPESWQNFVSWFWSKVDDSAGPEECWPWTGYRRPDGYGIVQRIMGLRAHRVALMLARGPIPQGQEALHSCDYPPCCNPRHLRAGTRSENMADAVRRGRHGGAEWLFRSQAKVTKEQVREIRRRRTEPRVSLAAEFGLSVSALDKIRNGYTWKDVA